MVLRFYVFFPFGQGLKLKIYNFWTPKPSYNNDRNIMDVRMEDKILTKSKWKMIKHINLCCLYIKAFNISNLLLNGINVHMPYLDGKERGNNELIKIPKI